METKHCPRCDRDLPTEDFAVSAKNGRQTYCRGCNTDYMREWTRTNAEKKAANRVWTHYRLRPADWQATWDAQEGRCLLCGTNLVPANAVLDHDHRCCPGERSCGRCNRGFLCRKCNTNVGWLETQECGFLEFLDLLRGYVDRRAERVTELDEELAVHRNGKPVRASIPRQRGLRSSMVRADDF